MMTSADQPMARCSACGRVADPARIVAGNGVPWTWSQAIDRTSDGEHRTILCDSCTREHSRSIEAKLDGEW